VLQSPVLEALLTDGFSTTNARIVQKPVEAQVSLREERATVTRRPVDRPVTDTDKAFQEQSIEVRESTEEPVVAKTARVVEEVRVGKGTDTREETIPDTVRKTEVHVERWVPEDR
jgi:stress response protein YsnF